MEAINSVTDWFQKMWITIKQLVLNPGDVAREYNQGNTGTYFQPLLFVIIWAGLNCLAAYVFKIGIGELDPTMDDKDLQLRQFALRYGILLWALCVPLMALAPYLVYQKSESKFRNHIIILCYIAGFNLMINIPSFIIAGIWEQLSKARDVYGAGVPFLFCIYFYQSYFKSDWWKSILAALLTILFLMISWFIILAINLLI